MSDSKRQNLQSSSLEQFIEAYKTASKSKRDILWNSIKTPLVEEIEEDKDNSIVTFLYRGSDVALSPDFAMYLDCSVLGVPFSENSQLNRIPETDLFSLILKLPNTLRTSYTFLQLDKATISHSKNEHSHTLYPYPEFVGSIKIAIDTMMRLHEEKKYAIDVRNPKKISYTEFENPDNCFFTESILELPQAPLQETYLTDIEFITKERKKLAEQKRFLECNLLFSETSLKNNINYKANPEDKSAPQKGQRKYWIYLPPEYSINSEKTYPLCIFLDGSEYLTTIPVPSILERMIKNKELPPCIAVFLEYSPDRRLLEYYADKEFTYFLAENLINILHKKDHLSISNDPKEITVIGMSASGLAAIYAGLQRPDVFGNVITHSAALWPIKQKELYKWVDDSLYKKFDVSFNLSFGSYETAPLECRFEDGFNQSISISEANQKLATYMHQKGIKVQLHEFIGGHNTICYRSTLPGQLKEIFVLQLGKSPKKGLK